MFVGGAVSLAAAYQYFFAFFSVIAVGFVNRQSLNFFLLR